MMEPAFNKLTQDDGEYEKGQQAGTCQTSVARACGHSETTHSPLQKPAFVNFTVIFCSKQNIFLNPTTYQTYEF